VSEEEREILRVAREKAMDVLSASSVKAEQVADEAEADAVALLLEQHELAERLLQEQEEAVKLGSASAATEELLKAHRVAAELLGVAQEAVAEKLRLTKTNAGVDALMAGQREAAAILLDAWMRVTEARPPAGERSD
jgi:hypothetical protein